MSLPVEKMYFVTQLMLRTTLLHESLGITVEIVLGLDFMVMLDIIQSIITQTLCTISVFQ